MRFFIDNTFSHRLARALHELPEADGHEVHHLKDMFPPSTPDQEWLRKLQQNGDWILITGDIRIVRQPHTRAVWRETGLTSFFFRRQWMHRSLWDQAWRMTRWWPTIQKQAPLVSHGAWFEVPLANGYRLHQVSSR